MKARNVKVEVFEASSSSALQDAVNDWLADRGEEELVDVFWQTNGTTYWAFFTYVEE